MSAAKQDVKVCGLVGSSEGRECGEGAWRWQRGAPGVFWTPELQDDPVHSRLLSGPSGLPDLLRRK